MFVNDEFLRQETIREMESFDGNCEIEDAAKLYESGWSIIEIATSKDVPIKNVIDALKPYISVKPEDIELALQYTDYEEYEE